MQLLNALRETLSKQSDRSASATIPPSDCYSILQNERRRHIITYLVEFDVGEEVECSAVADHLATLGDDRQAAYISIIQQHASRLEKSGLVIYREREKQLEMQTTLSTVYTVHKETENTLKNTS